MGLLSVAGCGAEPAYREPEEVRQLFQPVLTEGSIYGDALPPNTVVLTYDDGPDEHTLELAQYLNEQGIQATFFINGRRICKELGADGSCLVPMDTRPCNDGMEQFPVAEPSYYPESLLHQVASLGHRLANHTTDHCHLPGQDNPEDFVFELGATQEIIDRHICDGLYLFRAPYGQWDAQAAQLAQADPLLDKLQGPVNWDVDGGDWDCFQQGVSVEQCGDGYLNILNARPNKNGIFLNHDRLEFNVGTDGALRLAQYLVPKLKEAGYQFSTLDALLDHDPTAPRVCDFEVGMGGAGMGGSSGVNTGGAATAGMPSSVGGMAVVSPDAAGALSTPPEMMTPPTHIGAGGMPSVAPAPAGAAPVAGASPSVETPQAMAASNTAVPQSSTQLESGCGVAAAPHRESRDYVWLLALGALLLRRRGERAGSLEDIEGRG